MLGKIIKSILVMTAGAGALVATPASAGMIIYYGSNPDGPPIVGYQIYCDSGALLQEWGVITPYTMVTYQAINC